MQIETARFGIIEVEETTLIHFPWGIPAFEEVKQYVLLEQGNSPFHWLQATHEPSIAFVVCSPEVQGIKYLIPREKTKPIQIEHEKNLAILNIVSFQRDKKLIKFHSNSPLLFNTVERIGYQWSMDTREAKKYIIH